MNIERRLILLAAVAASVPAFGQAQRRATIALLMTGSSAEDDASTARFISEMARRGWIEGQSVTYRRFFTKASREAADELARQAVQTGPDLIYTPTGGGVLAARKATATIPIVFIMVSDPVASGFVSSLRQPGQNATGVYQMGADAISKRYELLHELLPRARRIGFLIDSRAADHAFQKRQLEESARPRELSLHGASIAAFDDVPAALDRLKKDGASVFIVPPSFTLTSRKPELIRLALERQMAPIAYRSDWAEAGALMTYGADMSDVHRRSAEIADRVLNGSRPADTPVELAAKFELIVNERTAKRLGITIPQAVLARADRIIR